MSESDSLQVEFLKSRIAELEHRMAEFESAEKFFSDILSHQQFIFGLFAAGILTILTLIGWWVVDRRFKEIVKRNNFLNQKIDDFAHDFSVSQDTTVLKLSHLIHIYFFDKKMYCNALEWALIHDIILYNDLRDENIKLMNIDNFKNIHLLDITINNEDEYNLSIENMKMIDTKLSHIEKWQPIKEKILAAISKYRR